MTKLRKSFCGEKQSEESVYWLRNAVREASSGSAVSASVLQIFMLCIVLCEG